MPFVLRRASGILEPRVSYNTGMGLLVVSRYFILAIGSRAVFWKRATNKRALDFCRKINLG